MNEKRKLLLTPDEATGGASEVDPLSAAAGGIDTSFPCLAPDQIANFKVKSAKKKVSDKGNTSVSLRVSAEKEVRLSDMKVVQPGFTFTQNVNITPSENFDIDAVKRNIALWMKSILGLEKAKVTPLSVFRDNPESLEGLVFTARTGVKKDKNGVYGDQTVLTPMLPA